MYLLIEVAGYIDAWPTIFLVMLTAVIGVALLKRQGLATLTRGMGRLQQGEVPAREMAEGILLAVAGALLVTPGFVTDTIGFLLLFPPSRFAIARRLLEKLQVHGPVDGAAGFTTSTFSDNASADATFAGDRFATRRKPQSPDAPVTLEGDFEKRDP